ncbi:tRNA (adenosine(37)-N6)-dimethylallyltransferase MiaA [Winogradskyella sp. R77965]|uniref:tRNA (adenosine(37)-N6)-dimethylallyltransferase MiaA n=1 Tax=Winogradskyella sp. R77965 TaxID=3093872 RepID=UPI0037DC8ECB
MTNTLISIVGPTAIGKTALSVKLAQHFNTEIISADSRQFYRELHIGTAVPSKEELKAAKHHFIQHKSIKDNYSVGDFEREAISKLEEIHQKHSTAIMVGGSGLYIKAVTKGLDYFPEIDSTIRNKLNDELISNGLDDLQERLKSLDPIAYKTIAIDNPQRVIRALEICIGTDKPYSSFLTNPEKTRHFKTISIGLDAERSLIYDRINQRVDIMITNGLLEEAEALIPFKYLNALNTVGYKELFNYFEGNSTLDFAISEIKKNTRRFAKRQLTWFRKDESTKWFDFETEAEEIIKFVEEKM